MEDDEQMKQYTLEVYDTTANVYEISHEDFFKKNIEIEGIEDGAENLYVRILDEGHVIPASREKASYYAVGFAKDKDFIVTVSDVDTKQLSNIFLLLGAYRANALPYDISKITIREEEFIVKEMEKISPEVSLGGDGTIVAGTIKAEDIKPVKQNKKKKK